MDAAAELAAANARIERNMQRGLNSRTAAQRKARDERAARRTRKREGIPDEPGTPAEEVPVEDVRRAMGGRHRRRHRRSRKTRRRHR